MTKLAAERKAGTRRYASAATEQQARAQIETSRRFSRVGKWLHPKQVTGRHPFLNTAGVEQAATFKGRDLAVMQTYREDVHGRYDRDGVLTVPGALQTGDGRELAKYRRMKIYDADGNRSIRKRTSRSFRLGGIESAFVLATGLKANCSITIGLTGRKQRDDREAIRAMSLRRMSPVGNTRRHMRQLPG
jgi:hypothetical protein